ncbi:FtsK/SpoIIIE domain-containing protein [Asanoa sp. WMMD1127]|uniref:FtsK/SpoIIIE domain-containing protein n=1 Tax=Asanoa sp. WMMD1127 TaxID=3016107 RepID=UPI002415F370|nr:FtsK/SpoIIIE domain-containing protein [Asanoa sp. WMMD1127]MDG4823335.1 FtsK/SpoIIIE domain-containing protein [Asanoa sp. WMMD1127]
MTGARARLVAEVRAELAAARGQARATSAAAESRRASALERLRAVREAHLACVKGLGAERERARRAIEASFVESSRRLAASLADVEPDHTLVPVGTVPAPGCDAVLPALLPLLDRGHLWFSSSMVDDVVRLVLLRVLTATPPGSVRLTVYDPERLGGTLSGFAPLGAASLVRFVGPGALGSMVDELVEEIGRINAVVLAAGHTSVTALSPRPAPWQVVVLLGDAATAAELTPAQQAQLDRVVRLGPACGIHLVVRGLPVPAARTVVEVSVADGVARSAAVADLPITLDPAPSAALVAGRCRAVAEAATSGPPAASFLDLLPGQPWTCQAIDGVSAPVGTLLGGAAPVSLALGDDPPHALIGGPSGSGKTNLIYAWLGALCARYSPDELALYLLDFKEGVSFARFAPSRRDPSWLPHVRLVGVNINNDREFGLALLRHLGAELRTRAAAAKRHDATKLSELRAEDPGTPWPRIVAVIDEFQVLLAGRDAVTTEAVALLEDLARRGRSQGIHLVLASQDVSGIEALWGRSGLVAQFTLRVALPKARRILAETNPAADSIPRHTAVVNADSGVTPANQVVRIPDASDRDTWRRLQHDLWQRRPAHTPPPRLFDGDAVPLLPASLLGPGVHTPPPRLFDGDAVPLLPASCVGPAALLGETIDVGARPATFALDRAPGRNLAVLGTRASDATAILTAAALSLAPTASRFSVACLDDALLPTAATLTAALPNARLYDRSTVSDLVTSPLAADGGPHVVIGFVWDARPPGIDLKPLLTRGPENGTHVLGWWRTVARLRDDLGGPGTRTDAIGAWVALDIHGPDLSPLSPQPGGPTWHPRDRRALYFDRNTGRPPEVVVPYEIPADRLVARQSPLPRQQDLRQPGQDRSGNREMPEPCPGPAAVAASDPAAGHARTVRPATSPASAADTRSDLATPSEAGSGPIACSVPTAPASQESAMQSSAASPTGHSG